MMLIPGFAPADSGPTANKPDLKNSWDPPPAATVFTSSFKRKIWRLKERLIKYSFKISKPEVLELNNQQLQIQIYVRIDHHIEIHRC